MRYMARIVKTRYGVKKIIGVRQMDRFDNTFNYMGKKYKIINLEPSEEYEAKKYFYYDVTDNYQITNAFTIERLRTNAMMSDIDQLSVSWVICSLMTLSIVLLVVMHINGYIP